MMSQGREGSMRRTDLEPSLGEGSAESTTPLLPHFSPHRHHHQPVSVLMPKKRFTPNTRNIIKLKLNNKFNLNLFLNLN